MIVDLNYRSREIFRRIVETYLETGVPVGSQAIAQSEGMDLSAASIRSTMASLEEIGLLFSPHISAGRIPTDRGLRLFIDGLLEIGNLTEQERLSIMASCSRGGENVENLFDEAIDMLSGLSHCAGLVFAPKIEAVLSHVEFVSLGPGRAMVVMVYENGSVENRVIETPLGLPPSSLVSATNYLSTKLRGKTLEAAQGLILKEIEEQRAELDELSAKVVAAGLATKAGDNFQDIFIVRGHANLLDDVKAIEDLERVRLLFDDLEHNKELIRLLELTDEAQGVKIFIGSETKLFSLSGSSLIVAPYMNQRSQVIGAVGVIGPTRLNYARIIPMVDYTAQVIGQMLP